MATPVTDDYGHGIHALDAGYLRPGLAAVHLMLQAGHAAIIDTGTNQSVPRILDALGRLGVPPAAVDYVILTHVHLDHAGAAGALLSACPNARLLVHPRGARHMIDPQKLVQGSIAVYGEALFRRLYGEIVAAPAERVIEAGEGFSVDFRGRRLSFLDTPGHARHHVCIHDSLSGGVFTGDSFGISYRDFDVDGRAFIFPTTTPVQFEPEAMHASVDRIVALQPAAAFLTHYGRVTEVAGLAADLHARIDALVAVARGVHGSGQERLAQIQTAVGATLLDDLRSHGCRLEEDRCRALLANDVELNAQGLLVWLERG